MRSAASANCTAPASDPTHSRIDWPGPWNFATPDDTHRRLETAGFAVENVWLQPEPTPFEPGEPLETFLSTVVLGAHLDRLLAADRPAFVKNVAAGLPKPEIDYVRLNIVARRSAS